MHPSSIFLASRLNERIKRYYAVFYTEKLRELNAKQNDSLKVSNEKLECLVKLVSDQDPEQFKFDALDTLMTLLNWSDDVLFPVLDITRLAVLCQEVNDALCTEELLQIVKKHIKSDALPSNQMLTFRLLANMFSHDRGEKLCLNSKDEILQLLSELESLANKNNQVHEWKNEDACRRMYFNWLNLSISMFPGRNINLYIESNCGPE